MDAIKDIKRPIAIVPKVLNPIAIEKTTTKQEDAIIDQAVDLISNPKFRPYFFKTLKIIGPAAFYEAMDWARKTEARCQPCVFVKRLKELRTAYGK